MRRTAERSSLNGDTSRRRSDRRDRCPSCLSRRSLIATAPAEPPRDLETVVTRWEYATAPLISHALQQILNQWGSDGWELVDVAENVAYFKRPLPEG